jgi:hypothetical protein
MKADNNFELCEEVCKLEKNILGSAMIDGGKMVAGFSKPGVPIPNEERFKSILFQIELITAIHRGNEDFYGTMKYHTVHYADSSLFMFPIDKYGSKKRLVLAFKIVRPYNQDEVASKVQGYLEKAFA